jgi:hypothetical protein
MNINELPCPYYGIGFPALRIENQKNNANEVKTNLSMETSMLSIDKQNLICLIFCLLCRIFYLFKHCMIGTISKLHNAFGELPEDPPKSSIHLRKNQNRTLSRQPSA